MDKEVKFIDFRLDYSDWEKNLNDVITGLQWLISTISNAIEKNPHSDEFFKSGPEGEVCPMIRFQRESIEKNIPAPSKTYRCFEVATGCEVMDKRKEDPLDFLFSEDDEFLDALL